MEHHFIPAEPTIGELKEQADACDAQAANEPEPFATQLREKAKLLRKWVEELSSGRWTALQPEDPPETSP